MTISGVPHPCISIPARLDSIELLAGDIYHVFNALFTVVLGRSGASDYLCPLDLEQPIDAQAEDKRIKDAVAMYKKELNKAEKPDRQV